MIVYVLCRRTPVVACGKCASPEDVSQSAFANVAEVIQHVGPDSRSMCLPAARALVLCTQP